MKVILIFTVLLLFLIVSFDRLLVISKILTDLLELLTLLTC